MMSAVHDHQLGVAAMRESGLFAVAFGGLGEARDQRRVLLAQPVLLRSRGLVPGSGGRSTSLIRNCWVVMRPLMRTSVGASPSE
jgi:hypothetical protein